MSGTRTDYVTNFIIEAGRVSFEAGERVWRMRQPTPEEAADGDSAYRLTHGRVMGDERLLEMAEDGPALEKEAAIRAAAAEAVYMLPLLLETDDGQPAFDVHDADSMAAFEALDPEVIVRMTDVYWGPVQEAIREAKKKSRRDL